MTFYVYCAKGEEFARMADRSADTVKRAGFSNQVIIYTDRFYDDVKYTQRVMPEYFEHPFMVTNLLCQVDHLCWTGIYNDYTVFLDADILASKPIDIGELHALHADLHPTYRTGLGQLSDLMPYNYGVLIVRHSIAGTHAMHWLLQRVMKLRPERQKWYGNQIALRELCGPVKQGTYEKDVGYFRVKIAQLPCQTWNWSPHPKHAKQPGTSKHFIHLKGTLKDHYFDHFYDKIMNRNTAPSIEQG